MGSAAFDVAAAVGLAVPAVVAGYLPVAGLATGILAAAPGAVDFVTTVRPAGGRSARAQNEHKTPRAYGSTIRKPLVSWLRGPDLNCGRDP
jgi:hypothetical protein